MNADSYVEILQQQCRNADQWGGAQKDDTRGPDAWLQYIEHQLDRSIEDLAEGKPEIEVAHERLVKIASLCLDGLNSMRRKGQI